MKQADKVAAAYDPAADDYDLSKDPRCLYGWGPPDKDCVCRFGHACFRAFGHAGKCTDYYGPNPMPCDRRQRPENWDTTGRAEANT